MTALGPPLPNPWTGSGFYVTGGTLRPDAPSYVERQADKDLWEGLLRGEFCYVLTSRQMGKSSLMVRAVRRLRQEGSAVAVLDLTAIGQNLTIHQWYDGLMARLGQQLNLEEELLAFGQTHTDWSPLQRWTGAIEKVVLARLAGRIVIFIDEIDLVRSLPFFTDEFFAAIRECYNRRARESAFNRLAFGLLGVAAPSDLIRDARMTPFNIGRRIELDDFTTHEAATLAQGLDIDDARAGSLLKRVLFWTGGHPYLTQRLCSSVAESLRPTSSGASAQPAVPPPLPNVQLVDRLATQRFLSRQARDRDDNLIFVRERLLHSEGDVAGLLYLYRRIYNGQPVPDDETKPLVATLRLSGIVRCRDGYLQVRNRIYCRVFDLAWVDTNMPQAELRRQRHATRRGVLVGFAIALALLIGYHIFEPMVRRYRNARLAYSTIQELSAAYRRIRSYRDTFDATFNLGLGGTTVPVNGSGSVLFEKPNQVLLAMRSAFHRPELELDLISDGERTWVVVPSRGQYQELQRPPAPTPFDPPPELARALGPLRVLPLYRLLLAPPAARRFLEEARDLEFLGTTNLNAQRARVIRWRQESDHFLASLGLTNRVTARRPIPVTAWVNPTNALVLQLQVDLSPWAAQLLGSSAAVPVTSLIVTETHRAIQTTDMPGSASRFRLEPAPELRPVAALALPAMDLSKLALRKRQFSQWIPARLAEAPPNLIDLTAYYNAAFVQTWHPGVTANYVTNSLNALPRGLLQLGGVWFDVRGIVQLSGLELQKVSGHYPQQITGIHIGQICRQLHFLQATGWRSPDGTTVGTYRVHYAGGQQLVIPIIYGQDVRDWNAESDSSTRLAHSTLVWSAVNDARVIVRLFKTTWVNPLPETEITSLDYTSAMADAAPFLIALTADR